MTATVSRPDWRSPTASRADDGLTRLWQLELKRVFDSLARFRAEVLVQARAKALACLRQNPRAGLSPLA
ncbi:hypothetical protein Lfu02_67920 [Longispora fulva]|uniref:Uncharacterized protein n=1 Tax=Longispora fulva TaxID=619741 RepID=A0A8J7GGC9_9ACTN|nr:hypothetical protein [Longispora fulva]GIG62420.1 hypothetical protein Lfu02_67920 [Longispora fulva]